MALVGYSKFWKSIAAAICVTVIAPAAAFARFDFLHAASITDLDFGKVANLGGGEVRISANGQRTITGQLENLGGEFGAATVELTGKPNRFFVVQSPLFSFIRKPKGRRLVVSKIVSDPLRFGRLDRDGRAEVTFGGVMRVGVYGEAGHYRGRIRCWVVYL